MADEIDTIEQDDTETAAQALEAGGDKEGALSLRMKRLENENKRLRAKETQRTLADFKTGLVKEFEYADPELITGGNEAQMRASAERLHNSVARVITAKGLTAAAVVETDEQRLARLKEGFGASPAVATEAVTGEAPMEFIDLQYAALQGKDRTGKPVSRAEILSDIKNNGPRRIERQTIAGAAIKARGEAAQ